MTEIISMQRYHAQNNWTRRFISECMQELKFERYLSYGLKSVSGKPATSLGTKKKGKMPLGKNNKCTPSDETHTQ